MELSVCGKFNRISISMLALLTVGAMAARVGLAQQKQDFAGDYSASLGPMHAILHITAAQDGKVSANVDSPDQRLFALPCSEIQINGPALTFTVPNVRGEWTGVMSADHNTLSGVWKQGDTMALVFTRGTESASGSLPAVSSSGPAGGVRPTPAAAASLEKPCTTMLGASYWDGSAWKAMMIAAHLGAERSASLTEGVKALGRNPFNSRAGITNVLTFKNSAAALTLEPSPKFCVFIPSSIDPTVVMIGSIEVKKDHRELETCSGPCASKGRNSDDWMPEKRVQPVNIRRISDNTIEITPKTPFRPGQYIIGGPPLIGYYDFGVGGESSAQ